MKNKLEEESRNEIMEIIALLVVDLIILLVLVLFSFDLLNTRQAGTNCHFCGKETLQLCCYKYLGLAFLD